MLLELFVIFLKLGTFTIGGGIAMLPLLQHSLVDDKKWYTKDEFVDIVAICQSLPGIVAINMATYVGYKKRGLLGSIISTIGVIFPSFIIILIISKALVFANGNSMIDGAMMGLRAAALGLVLVSFFQLGKTVFKDKMTVVAAIASFTLIVFLKINTAYVILLFLILGIISSLVAKKRIGKVNGGDKK